MPNKSLKNPVRWPILLVLLLCLSALWQHQAIHDWWRLRGYSPPASIVQLADQTQLTLRARRIFYINHPVIADRGLFNASCSNQGEHTIVLGCYHPVDRGIFIFQVTDARLTGVDQVTSAHEMLHAAYDRLSSHERKTVDTLLQEYYDHDLKDDRIRAIVAAYQKSEPSDVVNEMHSIFGTEIDKLPTNLEQYYTQYFQDRSRVVGYANSYQTEFTSRQSQVADIDVRLQKLKRQIDDSTAALDGQEADISALRKQLDNDRASSNIDSYNSNVPVFNAEIDGYNAAIKTTRGLITHYNQLVADRNDLALQVTELAHSIDSTFKPISQ